MLTVKKKLNLASMSILYKPIAGRYRPVRVADGPITAHYRFIKNASWVGTSCIFSAFRCFRKASNNSRSQDIFVDK